MMRSSAVKLLWALLLVMALIAGACGNDDGGTAEPPATAAPTAEATPEATAAPTAAPTEGPTPAPTEAPEPTPEATAAPTEAPTPEATPAPEPTAAPTPEATPAPEPETHPSGLDVAAINAAAADWMEKARIPGLVLAVTQGGEEPWTFAWGVSDLTTEEPITAGDYIRIGSVTKPVTTVAVLSMVDEGLLDLDTPVTAYLGDDWYGKYEHGPQITLRHLMGHTTGFVEYAFDPGFFVLGSARLGVPIAPEEIVRFTTNYGPVAEFETEYNYSTAGHVIAGMIIEAVTGNPADVEIRSRVLEPLGLENTYLPPNELPPVPVIDSYNGGLLYSAFTSLTRVPDSARHNFMGTDYLSTDEYPQEFLQTAGWTGGGIETLIGDVPTMFRGLFTGGVISDESLTEMTTAGVNPGYGLGVGIDDIGGRLAYSHGGGTPAFRTRALYIPELDLALAATTNVLPPDPDLQEFVDALLPIVMESWGLN
ncbi:serine hydrolase [Candidatus Poriferisocius sp.]|uniref:serine hydrolase n=1 Tax=Candidatus Poriferisocius sp. TaxID=3101276 RepID=UPI003B019C0A